MTTSLTPAAAIRAVLDEHLAQGDVVLLGETAGRLGATQGLSGDAVLDLTVADRGTLGVALGMALGGKRPVVELSGTDRLLAGQEVLHNAARIASKGDFAVPLVVRVPWGDEADVIDASVGASTAHIDGLTVVCASDANTADGLLRHALAGNKPVVLLEPRCIQDDRGPVSGKPIGANARVLREGSHVTLAAWGGGVGTALQAAEVLAAEGILAEVVDLVALQPIDSATVAASVQKTGRLVVVHPNDLHLANAALAVGLDEAFLSLESPLTRAADAPGPVAQAARDAVFY